MLSTRTHALISGSLLLVMIVAGWGGSALQASGVIKHPESLRIPMMIFFFGLFLAFGFSMVPTMVKVFVDAQGKIGNENHSMVRFIGAHETGVILAVWGFWILGLSIAMPVAIRGGFLSSSDSAQGTNSPGASSEDEIAREIARTPSQGTLVAAPGMSVSDMIKDSTLKIDRGGNPAVPDQSQSQYAGGAIFTFRVAGTGIEFPRCRYYFVTTFTNDRQHIESINVGTAQASMSKSQLDSANAAARAQLKADGWLSGREVYRDEEDQRLHGLHGGKLRGDEGWLWLKGDTVLHLESRRIDDPVAGEDRATAGEWIQFVELWKRSDYPYIERFEFDPPRS